MRDYNKEAHDTNQRQYAYDFDFILRKFMMRSFEPFLVEGKALELGCYKGDFTEIITNYFKDISVVEASEELSNYTKNRLSEKIKVITSVFETVEFQEKYDTIFFIHTLEHIDDPVFVLERVNSWLSDKGRLFIAVPNGNAPSRQIAVKMGLISHNSAITEAEFGHGHRITYTFDTLERDASKAGLKIVNRGGVFFKALANFQFDKILQQGLIDETYLEGCYKLGMQYPDLCASIYLVCEKG